MSSSPVNVLRSLYRTQIQLLTAFSTAVGRAKLRFLGRARLGRGVMIAGPVRVMVIPGGRLIIGDNVRLQSGFRYNPVGSECVTGIWVGPRGRLEIEAGAGLSGVTLVCREALTIGAGTLIGGGVRIYDTDFHALDPVTRREHPEAVPSAPVRIGANCFIGGYSLILKGVTIGDGSVVGAGSVVAKSIPPGEIWAGNPARRIRALGVPSAGEREERPA